MDRLLDDVASRKHQAIVRFYFVYPGHQTTVPEYIKRLADYHELPSKSEGKPTTFADWSHPELKRFTLAFYDKLAQRYDNDPRLAFLETGFGLWAEYHIYDGPMTLGKTFPDKPFQAVFARRLAQVFQKTPWMISVDAAEASRTPLAADRDLLTLPFGVFDDSFLCRQHAAKTSPTGISSAATVGSVSRPEASSVITPAMTKGRRWRRAGRTESPLKKPRRTSISHS